MKLRSWLGGLRSQLARPPMQIAGLLAFLAVVPAFSAAPGAMPADSKLYLYLNPGRFLSDALWSFDPRQFAGWVPHQHISFLWPSGPWFKMMDILGVPDWVAHRGWITLLFLAAGLGVVWSARILGLTWAGAAIAAVIYQLSPYTLAYVGRTSVMLLPWAGLGWILALTVMATRSGSYHQARWRYPALLALVVMTVGSVNPTAILMVAPAPVLWILHAVASRLLTARQAAAVIGRISVLSIGVSAWWMAMVMTQRRHGAEVLGFSETLEDVSATATATEVLRGLGYWLFYVRDAFGPATTASAHYLTSLPGIFVSFALPLTGLWAIATTRWIHRRFAAALVVIGGILAVGVHPIDQPSPFMGALADTDLALALRSSTRALPMLLLGLALVIGARLPLMSVRFFSVRLASLFPVILVTGICILNLPVWWSGGFVDPELRRESDPPRSWREAGAAIDSRDQGFRILQLPGAEFGSYRWGHTVDQPVVALTDRALITRDLLPLGSAVAMDLVFSLDDRIQRGVIPADAISVVSRLLGVDLVWLTNDLAHERYQTVRPETLIEVLGADAGLQLWDVFGDLEVFEPERERIDPISLSNSAVGAAVPAVMLWEVTDAVPVVRARSDSVVIGGSGDGIIDAAGAGLIHGHEVILYAGTSSPELIAVAQRLIVTDSARKRPRQWRSSQDVIGATESSDSRLVGLKSIAGDQRLEVGQGPYVTAEQQGTVRATASSYGERFAFLPEMRPAMAIDGDLTTAWRVGGEADPVGERLRLYFDEWVDDLQLLQPAAGRHITSVRIEITGPDSDESDVQVVETELGPDSLVGAGQLIELAVLRGPAGRILDGPIQVDIVITGVSSGPADPVGFARVGPWNTVEYLQIPDYGFHPHTEFLFTRDRVDPRELWRSDPELLINRRFSLSDVPTGAAVGGENLWLMDLKVSLDSRASDLILSRWLETKAVANSRLQGVISARGHSAVDGDASTAWVSNFVTATEEGPGPALQVVGLNGATDRIRISQPIGDFSRITEIEIDGPSINGGTTPMRVTVAQTAADGSEVILPSPIGPGPVQIRVTATEPRQVRDLRHGRMMIAPVAITEIDFGVPLATALPPSRPECSTDLIWLNGQPVPVRIDVASGSGQPCDHAALLLQSGTHLLRSTSSETAPGLRVDQVHLRPVQAAGNSAPAVSAGRSDPQLSLQEQTRLRRSVEIANCAPSCWLILGEGHNAAWHAEVAGRSLGPPIVVDGGFNGWLITPEDLTANVVRVEMRWTAQTPLSVAFGISGLFLLASVWLGRPRRIAVAELPKVLQSQSPERYRLVEGDWRIRSESVNLWRRTAPSALWALAAAALVGPLWAVVAVILSAPRLWGLRIRIAELAALLGCGLAVLIVVSLQIRRAPVANMAWPEAVGEAHQVALFAIVSLITVAAFSDDREASRR